MELLKRLKKVFLLVSAALLLAPATYVAAQGLERAGLPVLLDGNFIVADAMNAPFATTPGPGRVLEMNVMTGDIGVMIDNPLDGSSAALGLTGPWKPTGVLSGGIEGHAFINGAAQHTLSEFYRDGTHIRTVRPITAPDLSEGFGAMPRLLGSQFMPSGNIVLAVCDANFNDPSVFPPVSSSLEQARNSRIVVIDPETLQTVDTYNAPRDRRWTCMAGIIFGEDGMYVSMFHGATVFVIDWEAGLGNEKKPGKFKRNHLNKRVNRAKVVRVIDMYPGATHDDPRRRDSMRAITFDADGNLYGTNRARATEVDPGPDDMRHHVIVVPRGGDRPVGTLAMDHGVQIIAGLRTNRISGPGCDYVREDPDDIFPDSFNQCDFETLYVAASGTGNVMEYLINSDFLDGPDCRDLNMGCAQPIASFFGSANGMEDLDPRMLMRAKDAPAK